MVSLVQKIRLNDLAQQKRAPFRKKRTFYFIGGGFKKENNVIATFSRGAAPTNELKSLP